MRTAVFSPGILAAVVLLGACASEKDEEDFVDPPGVLSQQTRRAVLSRGAFTKTPEGALRSTSSAGFQVAFHGDYAKGFRLWKAEHAGAFVDVAVRGAQPSGGVRRRDGDLVYFPGVFPGVTSVFGASKSQVEEFFAIASAEQVPELVYDLSFGPDFGVLSQEGKQGEHLYAFDRGADLLFEIPQPVAFDANDKAWQGSWQVETKKGGATLRVKLDLSKASFPVLLDPAFVQPQWILRTNNEPPALVAPQSASGGSRLVMFGGYDADGNALNDAYVFQPSGWLEGDRTSGTTRPAGRAYGAMAYESGGTLPGFYLFGGFSLNASLDDLWLGTLSGDMLAWTQVPKSTAQASGSDPWPSKRFMHGMAVDTSTNDLYIAGGVSTGGNLLTDMWKGTVGGSAEAPTVSWTQVCASCVPGRYGAAWVQVKFPATQAGFFQFGGYDGESLSHSLFKWDGSTSWPEQTIADALVPTGDDGSFVASGASADQSRPADRYVGYAYSDQAGNLHVGGGVSNDGTTDTWINDTWVYDRSSGANRWSRFAQKSDGNLPGARESPLATNMLSDTGTSGVVIFGGVRDGGLLQQSRFSTLASSTLAVTTASSPLPGGTKYGFGNLITSNQEGYGLMLLDGTWQQMPSGSTCGTPSSPVSSSYCSFTLPTGSSVPTQLAWLFRDGRYFYTPAGAAGSGCTSGSTTTETCNLGTAFPGQMTGSSIVSLKSTLAAGSTYSCRTLGGGTLKCWGFNAEGELGQGDTANRGDDANEMGSNLAVTNLGSGRVPTLVSANYAHSCAVLDDGTVKCWGYNGVGELGQGDTNNRGDNAGEMGDNLLAVSLGSGRTATWVSTGAFHSCAVLDNGTVKCWGYNNNGQLGQGNTTTRGDNSGEMGGSLAVTDLGSGRTAKALASGDYHTCAILDNGTVKCWGENNLGQLGQGDKINRGDNSGEMGGSLAVTDLGSGRTAVAIAAHFFHTCAILDNGSVKCWGANNRGQLGQGNTINRGDNPNEMGDNLAVTDLGTGRTAVAITAGLYHTCAILDNGTVKCWGRSNVGQLGYGDLVQRGDNPNEMGDNLPTVNLGTGRTAIAIASGDLHTCAVLDDDTVKCWGYNGDGELGQGNTDNRGDNTGEMGDSLAVTPF